MALQNDPVVKTQMLIRRPVTEVFEAFVDPTITTKFWFTKSSGRLAPGATVKWDWEMYGVSANVTVKRVEKDKSILINWDDPPRPVEWQFISRPDDTTMVVITTSGFHGTEDEVVASAIDSMQGFASVLGGAKAWLEHGIMLNLISDQHPDAHVSSST